MNAYQGATVSQNLASRCPLLSTPLQSSLYCKGACACEDEAAPARQILLQVAPCTYIGWCCSQADVDFHVQMHSHPTAAG